MIRAYVGLGSNLDGPAQRVERALHALAGLPQTRLASRSDLFVTAPWGVTEQPSFVNAVAALDTALGAHDLLAALLDIERAAGRVRGTERWGPRVLDLDLLLHGELCLDEPGLQLPHPHLAERAFVLVPLAQVAPDLDVPGYGRVVDLLARTRSSGCRRIDSPSLEPTRPGRG